MASPANEGGIGGKFRRPPRRAPTTPYARPPTALRGVRGGGNVEDGGGWISKLVDPASRLIANGASKLFSSMFRKRLTASTKESEEDHQSRVNVSQLNCIIPSSEVQNGNMEVGNKTDNYDSGGIAELEQLLKQKTFTRVEFDHLAELLRSRTVEKIEHEDNNKKREMAGPSVSENGIGSSKIHENLSVPAGIFTLEKQIVKDEAASPAELAKAYMCSKPCKVSTSVGNLRCRVSQDDANLASVSSTSRQLDFSVAPRSVVRFSGIPEHPEHGYHMVRPTRLPGRSVMYRMSRSPYFKVNHTPNVQVGESSRDGYSHPSPTQWTPSAVKSSGKQVLKRGRAALDDEFGSVGPIRRIRQKSNLMSSSKEAISSLSGKYLWSPSTPLLKDISKGSMSVQKPLLLDEWKYSSSGLQTENGISSSTMPPPQSSEKAHKLFQQLDKLLPSPKKKSSELNSIARDDSPSKLTLDMLHGSALRSMEDVSSSKFLSMQENGSLDTSSDSHLPNVRSFHSRKLDRAEENGPMKLAADANGVSKAFIPSKDVMCVGRSENIASSKSAALPVTKKPAFRITAPEDLLELDDDEYHPSSSTIPIDDADTMKSMHSNAISETTISDKPPASSSQSTPVSSSISFRKVDKKAFVEPVVTEKDNGFVFPVASDACNQSQPPLTPTMLTQQLDKPETQKEHTPSRIFSVGSKDVKTSIVTLIPVGVNDTSGIKVGERSESELPSAISATTTSAEVSAIDKSRKQIDGDAYNPSEITVPPGISTSFTQATFAFGAAASPILSNGSLHASSSTCPAPSVASTTLSEGPLSSVSANNISSSISSFVSSAAPTFSTVPTFQSGSAMSTTVPEQIPQQLDKSNSVSMEASSVKASPFGTFSSMAQGASSVIPSTGGNGSSDVATSFSIFGSTSPSISSLFSSMTGSRSSVATSTASPNTGDSLFGFNASTQPIGSSPSFATSFQNSAATICGASNGSSSSSSSFANSSSQNFTASAFGATKGSLFGTQSTPSGSGTSQVSQDSTSQFGSFTSSPSFGLANSSSGSFCTSPFGSATSGANPFTLSSGVPFSSSANNISSFAPASSTIPFGLSSQATTSSIFTATSNSSTSLLTGVSFGSITSGSNMSPFTVGSSSGSSSLTFLGASSSGSSSSSFSFGLNSGSSTLPFTVGSSFGSGSSSFTFGASSGSSSSPFTMGSSSGTGSSSFTFGASSGPSSSPFTVGSSSGSGSSPFTMGSSFGSSSSPFTFGSSSGSSTSPFAFNSSSGSVFLNSASPGLAFGAQKPVFGFGSGPPGNDQMNVEDSMIDVTNNAQTPLVPAFGQPANPPTPPGFMFGSPSVHPVASPTFQFGGLQNTSAPQNPSPFQSAGNADFNPGGSFSLGSGGGDKSARKFVKVKRGPRKK